MTVSSTTIKAQANGNGVTTAFSFPYYFLDETDLVVTTVVVSTGVETTKTLTTDYTVTGALSPSGGTVTFLVAPPTGTRVTIRNVVPFTQTTDFTESSAFPAEANEQALDKLTLAGQNFGEQLGRSFQLPVSTAVVGPVAVEEPVASNLLGWNEDGTAIINVEVPALDDAYFAPTVTYSASTVDLGVYKHGTNQLGLAASGRTQVIIKEDPDPGFPASGTDVSTFLYLGGHRSETAAADGSFIIMASGSGDAQGDYTIRLTSSGPNGGVHICNYDPATGSRIIANFDSATLADDHHTYINFSNADDGQSPSISAQRTYAGDSANVGLNFYTEGTATNTFRFLSDNTAVELFQIRRTASGVNYPYTQGSATGNAATIGVDGSDTNASLAIQGKGTGGVNIKGRTDGASLAAGYVGEVIEATLVKGSATSLAAGTGKTIVTLPLTKGKWEVTGVFITDGADATTFFNQYASISATTDTLDTTPGKLSGINDVTGAVRWANGDDLYVNTPRVILDLAADTNYYLVGSCSFATSTCTGYGHAIATRIA